MTDETAEHEPDTEQCSSSGCPPCSRWRLPLMLALVLAAIVAFNGEGIREDDAEPGVAPRDRAAVDLPSEHTVSLVVDRGVDAPLRFLDLPWHEGMTVADLLAAARQSASMTNEPLEYRVQGSGASAFLTTIGETTNEGASGSNWTYTVNGERADRSFAIYELEPNDQVLWSFSPSE